MSALPSLAPEWERIDLLGACLSAWRRGAEIPQGVGERLDVVQQQVLSLRREAPWRSVAAECGLEPVDQDILASSLAPEAEPRLGWMYQELQPGVSSPYPTPALLREMFLIGGREAPLFNQRLKKSSPLFSSGMIDGPSPGLYDPIRPSARACAQLLGWPIADTVAMPGAVEVAVRANWDHLVLPAHCVKALREFILWVTHRRRVEVDWGARVTGGPVALFAGPSGTGKSHAAEVVANALGWPLFRVDLGLLVSKYIGETEKNLNALFDGAHGKTAVLLFDEADSLFAKRGEVKEARDRYANMEVSHLLSRIERHSGPCILTSNLREHIDTAFTRRFQVVIDFPRPDASARVRLWRLHLPPGAPRAADVDPEILGREYQLSGAQIRNAALHAAFLAAGEGTAIGLPHIASAVWTELAKKGGELSSARMGQFASYLPSDVVP